MDPLATVVLDRLHPDVAFIGCNGIDVDRGVTNVNLPEAEGEAADGRRERPHRGRRRRGEARAHAPRIRRAARPRRHPAHGRRRRPARGGPPPRRGPPGRRGRRVVRGRAAVTWIP
ncbi:hypothetical protein [Clavibacter tessellarius]|uniref:hypothetical protein n=1 Tax=Clavibacter tessellarius TaxID=31965 RepID=UPI00324ECCAF